MRVAQFNQILLQNPNLIFFMVCFIMSNRLRFFNIFLFILSKRVIILNLKKIFIMFAIVFVSGVQTYGATVAETKAMIVAQAMEMGIDPALALSLAKVESNFRQEARSAAGAVGIYQLMPSTARKLGVNPYTLEGNIKGGLKYYLMMYKMFGSNELALAAYNAGPGNVKKFNAVPPYVETKRFVDKILTQQKIHQNDPCVLQAKAPAPVVTVDAPEVENFNPADLDKQKQSSIIIKMIDQEVTAI